MANATAIRIIVALVALLALFLLSYWVHVSRDVFNSPEDIVSQEIRDLGDVVETENKIPSDVVESVSRSVRVAVYPFVEISTGLETGYGSLLADLTTLRLGDMPELTVLDRSPAYLLLHQETHEDLAFSRLKKVADFVVSGRLLELSSGVVLVVEVAAVSDGSLIERIEVAFDSGDIDSVVDNLVDTISETVTRDINQSSGPILTVAVAPFFPSPDARSIDGEILPEIMIRELSGLSSVRLVQRINIVPILVESLLSRIYGNNGDFFSVMSPADILIQGYYEGETSGGNIRAVIYMTVGGVYTYTFSVNGVDWQEIAREVTGKVQEQGIRRQRVPAENVQQQEAFSLFVRSVKEIGFNYTNPEFGQSLGFDPAHVGRAGANHRCISRDYEEILRIDPLFDSARLALARCLILEGDNGAYDEIVTNLLDVILNARYQSSGNSARVAASMLGGYVQPSASDGSDLSFLGGTGRFEDYLPGSYYRGSNLGGFDRLLAYGQVAGKDVFTLQQPWGLPGEARWSYLMGQSVFLGKMPENPGRTSCKTPTPWNVNTNYFRVVAMKSIDYHAAAAHLSYQYPIAFLSLARAVKQFDVMPHQYANVFYKHIIDNYSETDSARKASVELYLNESEVLDRCRQQEIHSSEGLWSRKQADFSSLYNEAMSSGRAQASESLIISAINNFLMLCGHIERYRALPRSAEAFPGNIMNSIAESAVSRIFKEVESQSPSKCASAYPYLVMSIVSENPGVISEQLLMLRRINSDAFRVHPDYVIPFSYEVGMRARSLDKSRNNAAAEYLSEFQKLVQRYPAGDIALASVLGVIQGSSQAAAFLGSRGKGSIFVDYPCCGKSVTEYFVHDVTDKGEVLYRSDSGFILGFAFRPGWNVMSITSSSGVHQSRRRWNFSDSFLEEKTVGNNHEFDIFWVNSIDVCYQATDCDSVPPLLEMSNVRVHSGLAEMPRHFALPVKSKGMTAALSETQLGLRDQLWKVYRPSFRREIAPSSVAVDGNVAVVGARRAKTLITPDFKRLVRETRLSPDNLGMILHRLFHAGYVDVHGRPTNKYFEIRRQFLNNAGAEYEYWQSVVGGGYYPNLMGVINAFQLSTEETGAVFIYRRKDGKWNFEAQITPNDAKARMAFGVDVAIQGERITVCAGHSGTVSGDGGVYAFARSSDGWVEVQKVWDDTCRAVVMAGNWLAVKTPTHVRIFRFVSDRYEPTQVLFRGAESAAPYVENLPPLELDQLGVAMDEQTLVVSSMASNYLVNRDHNAGVVYIYQPTGDRWVLRDAIMAPFQGAGSSRIRFGESVLVRGDLLVIGSPWFRDESHERGSGMVSLYVRRGEEGWREVQRLRQAQLTDRPLELDFGAGLELIDKRLVIRTRAGEYYAPLPSIQ